MIISFPSEPPSHSIHKNSVNRVTFQVSSEYLKIRQTFKIFLRIRDVRIGSRLVEILSCFLANFRRCQDEDPWRSHVSILISLFLADPIISSFFAYSCCGKWNGYNFNIWWFISNACLVPKVSNDIRVFKTSWVRTREREKRGAPSWAVVIYETSAVEISSLPSPSLARQLFSSYISSLSSYSTQIYDF